MTAILVTAIIRQRLLLYHLAAGGQRGAELKAAQEPGVAAQFGDHVLVHRLMIRRGHAVLHLLRRDQRHRVRQRPCQADRSAVQAGRDLYAATLLRHCGDSQGKQGQGYKCGTGEHGDVSLFVVI